MLDNTHRLALELLPDSGLGAERAAEEAARLQVFFASCMRCTCCAWLKYLAGWYVTSLLQALLASSARQHCAPPSFASHTGLQEAAEALGEDGLAAVAQAAADLQAWQAAPSSPEALATVPSLRVAGGRG